MSTAAMDVEARNAGRDTRCRLCLKKIEIAQTAGIDLLENQDINRLLLDVYRVEVLQTDEGPTMICVPCYSLLVHYYKLRIRCLSLRKNFRLNQSVLLAQINAFRATVGQPRSWRIDEKTDKIAAVREIGTQTDLNLSSPAEPSESTPQATGSDDSKDATNVETTVQNGPAEEAATIVIDDESTEGSIVTVRSESIADMLGEGERGVIAVTMAENVPNEANMLIEASLPTEAIVPTTESVPTVKSAPTAETTVPGAEPTYFTSPNNGNKRMRIQQLIPVLVDFMKHPHYLEAIWPVKVSFNPDEPAPLVYMCRTCNKTFKSKDSHEHHQTKGGCVPTCRFCKSTLNGEHNCTFLKKYSHLLPHIVGNDKYCTKYENGDIATPEDDSNDTGQPKNETIVANDPIVNGSKNKKSSKRSRKSRRSISSSDRRSHTPNPKKSKLSDSQGRKDSNASSEPRTEGVKNNTTSIQLSSDEDDMLTIISEQRNGSIKRRRISSDA